MRLLFQRGDARREALLLAIGLWALTFLTQQTFILSLGVPAFLMLLPFLWCTHGLLLTWLLWFVMMRTERWGAIQRWLVISATVLFLMVAQSLLDTLLSHDIVLASLTPEMPGAALLVSTRGETRDIGLQITLMNYFWIFGMYAVGLSLLMAQRRAADAQEEARQARLAALRLQLNPHFLFNALNSVSSLIVSGRAAEAEATTLNLADFLHGSLTAEGAGLVPLRQELSTVEAYMQVEEARFADRLRLEIDVPAALEELPVPGFLLQPLVENAVKYAAAPAARPVTIRVAAEAAGGSVRLTVRDDGDPARAAAVRGGTGVGLRNTRERLHAFYGDRARLETHQGPHGFTVAVVLPRGGAGQPAASVRRREPSLAG